MRVEVPISVTSSPQMYDESSTRNIMWSVFFCLLPAAFWGVFIFGLSALGVLLAALASAALFEFLFARLAGQDCPLWDGSACVTGLLVGMTLPPSVPLYVPVFASLFAIGVVKWTFGGLGRNWMHPALGGWLFVYFSWPRAMTTWTFPRFLPSPDAVSSATPLGLLKTGIVEETVLPPSPLEYLASLGYPESSVDAVLSPWLNASILEPLGISLPSGYVDLFLGIMPGSIGEVSAFLLLASTVFLLARKILSPAIPAAYFGVFGFFVWVFGGLQYGGEYFTGDVLFHIFTGGLLLGVFYMAADIVASPVTLRGQLIFGSGAGFLTFLIRFYGASPEGAGLAILAMNVFTPLINRLTPPVRFGAPVRGRGRTHE
ncbi:MAG: RnfABCDGE type electron transport complex subunit D [Spirochaetales bacterium]|jgi:electron transport complex protein RnfD|nr:RnfABCDGE type electron transport complex subunit D [Spirochaetales bacterium]